MSNEDYISELLTKGIITEEQAVKMRAHAAEKPPANKVLLAVMFLGVLAVIIGVISIIAANWDVIPASMKLATNFLTLGALAVAGAKFYNSEKLKVFEGIAFGFYGLLLGSFAHIAQIFHVRGDAMETVLIWSIISFPVIRLSRFSFLPFVWTTFLLFSGARVVFQNLEPVAMIRFVYWLPVLLGAFALILHHFKKIQFANPVSFFAVLGFVTSLYVLDTMFGTDLSYRRQPVTNDFFNYNIDFVLTSIAPFLLVSIGFVFLPIQRSRKILLLIPLFINTSLFFWIPATTAIPNFVGGVGSIIAFASLACYFAISQRQRWFNFFILLIGYRFFMFFIQAFGGLLATGFGLVISGVFILLACYLFYRFRQRVYEMFARIDL